MSGKVVSWAFEQVTGSPAAKLVLVKLADNANDYGFCWVGLETIIKESELSQSAVYKHIATLQGLGLVRSFETTHPEHGYPIKAFQLSVPEAWQENQARGKAKGKIPRGGINQTKIPPGGTPAPHDGKSIPPGGTHIEEPSFEPSLNHTDASEDDASLRAKVWPAFQDWPGDLPTSASEASTLGVLDRLPDPPGLAELLGCIADAGVEIAASNAARGRMGPLPLMAPHNWLERRVWEKYLIARRAHPVRVAAAVLDTQAVMTALGPEVNARLRRARLTEADISALAGASFALGPPALFGNLTLRQENILRKHHQELDGIWPGIEFARDAGRKSA